MNSLLKVEAITLQKGKNILRGVSFEVAAGEILTVLGPSGAGKSSLLRCLNRLDSIDGGEVFLEGQEIRSLPILDVRRRVGMVFQVPALIPYTVKANLLLGPALRKEMLSDAECESLVARVGLSAETLHREADTLSVGEQQRVAFAQVLANRPDVLLLDEPTSALDPTAVLTIENLIRQIHEELKTATVLVTHDVAQARRFNTQTLVMVDGVIVACGNIEELINDTENDTLQKFFQGRLEPHPEGGSDAH